MQTKTLRNTRCDHIDFKDQINVRYTASIGPWGDCYRFGRKYRGPKLATVFYFMPLLRIFIGTEAF